MLFPSIGRTLCALAACSATVFAGGGTRLAAGDDHVLFLREDGSLWTAGANQSGQSGGEGASRSVPEAVGTDPFVRVSAGVQYSLALRSDGSLWAFGKNGSAQLGVEKCESVSAPRAVDSLRWLDVAAGTGVSLGIREDSALILWGDWKTLVSNAGLQGGRKGRPRQIGAGTWKSVAMGANHALALRGDGTLWAMGANDAGQTGCPHTMAARSLCAVSTGEATGDSSAAAAIESGAAVAVTSTGNAVKWSSVSAGDHFSVGVREDGSLWSWGVNTAGELGRGSMTDWEEMGRVGSEKWLDVSAGGRHVIALRADSTLWAWGSGADGALGLGSQENSAVPAPVSYEKWIAISAGKGFSTALRADGEPLIWGKLDFMRPAGSAGSPFATRPGYLERKLTVKPIGPAIFGGRDPAIAYTVNFFDSVSVSSSNPYLFLPVAGGIHPLSAGRGTVTIRAFPPAGSGEDTLSQVRTVTVAKARQTLAFPEPAPLAPGTSMIPGAVSSVGLPIGFVSLDRKVVRVVGDRLEAVGPGVAEVTAVQPGDANTMAAEYVTRKFTVLPAEAVVRPQAEKVTKR